MANSKSIVVGGGGPAGALAAANLPGAGRKVILFDEKLAWEKPCISELHDRLEALKSNVAQPMTP